MVGNSVDQRFSSWELNAATGIIGYIGCIYLSSLISDTALYFVAVATIAAFVGQYVVRRLISILGRASLIIFILSFTIFVSAISLGGWSYESKLH